MDELEEYRQQLMLDIHAGADADGVLFTEAFFEKAVEVLSEAGEIDSGTWSHYSGQYKKKNIAVTGYGGDPRDAGGELGLILLDFNPKPGLRDMGGPDVKKGFNKLVEFFRACRSESFRDALEETSDCAALADLIIQTWSKTERIKLILVTDASTKSTVDARSVGSVDGKPVTFSVWDLKRLRKFEEQGLVRENLSIDFETEFGGAVPILRASGSDAALESYLAVINGSQLADIYDRWGARLLESNVRSFLQAKGKVNQGIRKTITEEPHMFLPYNNGIAATADAVTVAQGETGLMMTQVENLQIVNGGQTTASIHAVRKTAAEQLKTVYVQMKLNIVPREISEQIVPKISEYANSQNKVNAADFFANHPFHVRMEEFSRRILAPAKEGDYQETKWFYERARGQYADARSKLTPSARKKFDTEYPRPNFFGKTDLAKFENSFQCKPHDVSLGAQKNFGKFAEFIGKRWGEEGFAFDEIWFKRLIAKAIVFRKTERLVSAAEWYENGYRANIVTYGIAKLVSDLDKRKKTIDLDRIWRSQSIPDALGEALSTSCCEAQHVILNENLVRHIGEWTKKEACWKALKERSLSYARDLDDVVVDPDEAREIKRDARTDGDLTRSVEEQSWIVSAGPVFWNEAIAWGKEKRVLSPRETGVLRICAEIPVRLPTENQCALAMKSLKKLQDLGFQHAVFDAAG